MAHGTYVGAEGQRRSLPAIKRDRAGHAARTRVTAVSRPTSRSGPRSGLTVSALQAAAILAGLQAAGADALALLGRVGLSLDVLADPERRLPREIILDMWQAALDVTGDEAFG